MNRALRRLMVKPKPFMKNWDCPGCGHHYSMIYAQSKDMPFYFDFEGCNRFFDKDGNDRTADMYPGGVPWNDKDGGTK